MAFPLRVLIVEDTEDDAILLLRTLKRSGYSVESVVVDTADKMREALSTEPWDIIISDYALPQFSGIHALALMHDMGLSIPFIIVSGTIGEDVAVQAMKAGAHDYVMKDNLARLIPAIERELQEGRLRDERAQREAEIEAIARIATHLRNAQSHKMMLEALREQFAGLVEVDAIAFLLRDMVEEKLVVELSSGAWSGWESNTIGLDEGITSIVLTQGQSYVTEDISAETRFQRPELINQIHAAVCVPLIADEGPIGAFWVGRYLRPFLTSEVRVLNAVSDIIANALQRARVLETLEERVTERTAELQAVNNRLTELDRLKSKFVSDVSHELRTPVTSLGVYLDLLRSSPPEKHDHYIDILQNQVRRLSSLVENILDLSKLESSHETKFKDVNVNDIVRELIIDLQPLAERKRLSLSANLATDLPGISGDYEKLSEVLTNLIGNAINYTPSGTINVETKLVGNVVAIAVTDTGLGIDEADIPHLFDRFYRGQTVSQSSIPGTGLGLSIVKEIIDLHQGTIDVKSAPGQGTTFTIHMRVNDSY